MTGKWTFEVDPDNRDAEPKDITDEYYHAQYDTITCPHCGCTLSGFVVMEKHYCYVCGGKFGKRDLTCDRCDACGTSRCICKDGEYHAITFDCNDCAYCMSNCHDLSMACETEEGKCDWFELWEGADGNIQIENV